MFSKIYQKMLNYVNHNTIKAKIITWELYYVAKFIKTKFMIRGSLVKQASVKGSIQTQQ